MIDATQTLKDATFFIYLVYGDLSATSERLPVSTNYLKFILSNQQDKVERDRLLGLGKSIFLLDTLGQDKKQKIYESVLFDLEEIIKSKEDCIFYQSSGDVTNTANQNLNVIQITYDELGKLIENHIMQINTIVSKVNWLLKKNGYSKTIPLLNLIV
jgi:hypothetical protein